METKLAALRGVLLSDGSIDPKRYTVTFTEDECAVLDLIKDFRTINGIKLKWKTDKHKNSLRARVYSKKLTEFLLSLSPSYRTRKCNTHPRSAFWKTSMPPTKIPAFIYKNKAAAKIFIRCYISCDGCPQINFYTRHSKTRYGTIQIQPLLKIGCDNSDMRQQLVRLLKILSIKGYNKKGCVAIQNHANIKSFYKTIGFLDKSRNRKGKNFKGFSKNNILKLLVLCIMLSEKYLWINKNFHDKKSLLIFFRKCLLFLQHQNYKDLNKFVKKSTGFGIDISYLQSNTGRVRSL